MNKLQRNEQKQRQWIEPYHDILCFLHARIAESSVDITQDLSEWKQSSSTAQRSRPKQPTGISLNKTFAPQSSVHGTVRDNFGSLHRSLTVGCDSLQPFPEKWNSSVNKNWSQTLSLSIVHFLTTYQKLSALNLTIPPLDRSVRGSLSLTSSKVLVPRNLGNPRFKRASQKQGKKKTS